MNEELKAQIVAFSILSRIVGTATRIAQHRRPAGIVFQYPQSDRGHCNLSPSHCRKASYSPFSILSRIVGTATSGVHGRALADLDFQYPQSDRGHCNVFAVPS